MIHVLDVDREQEKMNKPVRQKNKRIKKCIRAQRIKVKTVHKSKVNLNT